MGGITKIIIVLLWLPQALAQLLSWLYWWQVKEYRFDRFKVLLFSVDGRKNLGVLGIAVKLILVTTSIYFQQLFWMVLVVFLYLDVELLLKITSHRIRKPVFTQRARNIFAISSGIIILGILWVIIDPKNFMQIIFWEELLLLVSTIVGILWTMQIANKIKGSEIAKAKLKLKKINPTVIGITGSYGKTTTKEFLFHLLSKKFKTEKTKGNQNTEFGIARKILNDFKKDTEIFIAEMGAYKKGEIKALTNIAKPSIAIITGIESQHLDLFGSLDNIKKAKFEIVESLPKKGIAIFNLSNKHCRELAKKARRLPTELRIYGYYSGGEPHKIKADLKSKIVSIDKNAVVFQVQEGKLTKNLSAQLTGVHFVENLTGAILVARLLGVDWGQIIKACKTLNMPEGTMQLMQLKNGSLVIDDTYNSTPKGFASALDYLGMLDSPRYIITPGIIELGEDSKKIHKKLGELAREKVDKIILTKKEFSGSIKDGLKEDVNKLSVIDDINELESMFDRLTRSRGSILLEGRLPQSLIKKVKGLTK